MLTVEEKTKYYHFKEPTLTRLLAEDDLNGAKPEYESDDGTSFTLVTIKETRATNRNKVFIELEKWDNKAQIERALSESFIQVAKDNNHYHVVNTLNDLPDIAKNIVEFKDFPAIYSKFASFPKLHDTGLENKMLSYIQNPHLISTHREHMPANYNFSSLVERPTFFFCPDSDEFGIFATENLPHKNGWYGPIDESRLGFAFISNYIYVVEVLNFL